MGRSSARYHHGDLRNALLEQAVKLVEEVGADAFSLREAARLVGVSANAAYRHFADRSELLRAVAEVGFGRMQRRVHQALSSVSARRSPGTAVERAKAVGRAYVEFAVDHPELLRVMFGSDGLASFDRSGPPKPDPYAMLASALDELVAEGALPADRRPGAELKAWVVVHGFASLVVQGVGALQSKSSRKEALESVLDFAVVGLLGRLDS
jgi:AcrR family transcriptional regulator